VCSSRANVSDPLSTPCPPSQSQQHLTSGHLDLFCGQGCLAAGISSALGPRVTKLWGVERCISPALTAQVNSPAATIAHMGVDEYLWTIRKVLNALPFACCVHTSSLTPPLEPLQPLLSLSRAFRPP